MGLCEGKIEKNKIKELSCKGLFVYIWYILRWCGLNTDNNNTALFLHIVVLFMGLTDSGLSRKLAAVKTNTWCNNPSTAYIEQD